MTTLFYLLAGLVIGGTVVTVAYIVWVACYLGGEDLDEE